MAETTLYRERVIASIDTRPDEYLPFVPQRVHALRESVILKPAAESLRQGWDEARQGMAYPAEESWEGIDVRMRRPANPRALRRRAIPPSCL